MQYIAALEIEKKFIYDEGKHMTEHFADNRVWENLGHTIR